MPALSAHISATSPSVLVCSFTRPYVAGKVCRLSLGDHVLGPPGEVDVFKRVLVSGLEFRGKDSRARRSKQGCQHESGVYGEIQSLFRARPYLDARRAPYTSLRA